MLSGLPSVSPEDPQIQLAKLRTRVSEVERKLANTTALLVVVCFVMAGISVLVALTR